MEHDRTTAPKNLVICCDGTGNEISENISNVLKLYR
ncbi:phospholipase effector Tle1 domain-containing protein, partial [Bradyrhizobium ottawaense]